MVRHVFYKDFFIFPFNTIQPTNIIQQLPLTSYVTIILKSAYSTQFMYEYIYDKTVL